MRRVAWILWLLLWGCLACQRASQVPVDVAALDQGARWVGARSELRLGESLDMMLWIVAEAGKDKLKPQMTLPTLEGGRLVARGKPVRLQVDQKRFWIRNYRLTWLRLGEQELPSIEIDLASSDDKLATQSLDFDVAGILTEKDSLRAEIPIELLQEAPKSYRMLYWILGGLMVAIGIGWWLQHRLRGEMHAVDLGPELSPIQEARQGLARIEARWKAQDLDGESLVVAVSELLRGYLQNGLGFHSLTHTTEEFLAELHGSGRFALEVEAPLTGYLQQCDLIKFAAQGTDVRLCSDLLDKTRILLDKAAQIASVTGLDAPGESPEGTVRTREEVGSRG